MRATSRTGQFRTRAALRVVAFAGLVAATAGCSHIRDHRGYLVDENLVTTVQPGLDNRLSVEKVLGRPTFESQFGQKSWYYVSINTQQAPFTKPRAEAESIIKIDFAPDGRVATVRRAGMEKLVRLSPDRHATPTLGKNRGILEDIFGNIGAVGAMPGGGGQQGGSGGGTPGSGPNGS